MDKIGSVILQCFFIVLIIFIYSFVENQDNFEYQLSLIVVIQFIWQFLDSFKRRNTVISVIFLFLLAAFLFNGGEFVVKVFNPKEFRLMEVIYDNSIKRSALIFIALSFSCLYLGSLFFEKDGRFTLTSEVRIKDVLIFRGIGLMLLIISVGFQFSYLFRTLKMAMESGYYSIYSVEQLTGIEAIPKILRDFYIPSVLILFWCDVKLGRKSRFIWMGMLFFYSIMLFMIGYRGHAIMPILGFAFLYDKQYKRINTKKVALIGSILLFVVFPLIKNFRNATQATSISDLTDYTIESIQEMTILREMGSSSKTVGYTMQLVPSSRDFDFGAGYFWATTSLLPNVFGDGVHPAIKYANYGQWLTKEVNPYAAKTGGGVGFSFIAEAYLNFSFFGLFFLMLLGGALVKLEYMATKKSIYIIVLACFLSFFLMYSRGQFLDMTRAFAWYSFGPYLMYLFFRKGINT